MQQEMGINKLANMFMGNPQPLAAKVDQAQKQTGPGQIPPDLAEAIALQKIQEMHQAAQNQQAMQAGGPQPTVMDKLRQLTGTVAQGAPQGMPQGMPPQGMPPQGMPPVQAAHGGHIAQLVSNLSQHYGGGGIVAFSGEDERVGSEVPVADNDLPEWAIPLRAARLAKEAEARKRLEEERARNMAQVNAQPGEMRPVMQNDPRMMGATPAAETVGLPQALNNKPETQPPAPRPPAPPAPRPPAPQPGAAPAPQGLDALLESGIREDLGRNRDTEAQKMVEKQREMSGISDYQTQMSNIIARREAAQKEAQSDRTPAWVRGLQQMGGSPYDFLGRGSRAATAARDAYGEEDMKFANELDTLRKASMDAQLKGNMDLAKTYADQYKEVDSARRAAMQSGVGLQSNRNTVAQRAQAERHHQDNLAESRAVRAGTAEHKATIDAYKVRLASIDRELAPLLKMPFGANKDTIAALQAEKSKLTKTMDVATGIGTMSAAPDAKASAESKPGWGQASIVNVK